MVWGANAVSLSARIPICAGDLYCQIFRLRLQQLVSDFLADKLSIMVFLEQDVQEDIQRLMVYRGIIGKLEMALFDIIFSDAFLFFLHSGKGISWMPLR